ncbi:hypothetical protein [Microbacterium sp. Bi128]|uniref:hypothetical protein n=1 Tax=Microbacterium sp. Bi128 TaxID=2821115 RepID=UPI001D8FD6AF|nr:hypothetical protein [Microbacterium sp. Bi128]CAH0172964.1 hypothetical protein SRABI128_01081 [Microbacterium sp. Bi128]
MPDVVTRRDGAGFRYEADLVSVLRGALPRLAFRHEKLSTVEVFSEVPAVHGVPDLAGVRFDFNRIADRDAAGVRPLSTDTEVRAVLAIGAGATAADIAARAKLSPDYVRRAVLPLLSDLGWITRTVAGGVQLRPEARWVGRRVVTVEAKLRDWRKALAQARRQQLSADAAYIALDSGTLSGIRDHLAQIARGGIGVMAVDAELQRARVLVRPARVFDTRRHAGRALLAERSLEMMLRGTREGQIYPVFGRSAP